MKILAADTSTRTCSVALIQNDALIAETTTGMRETHSKHLMDMIDQLLTQARLDINALDALAVVKGPGSFTGLRIGISTVKGLAAATGIPVYGISALEALAWQCKGYATRIYPMIDARRDEVYTAGYRVTDKGLDKQMAEQVGAPDKVVKAMETPCLCIGTGALLYRELLEAHLGSDVASAPAMRHHVQASSVAYLAWQKIEQGGLDKNDQITPDYLRKSDAEINLKR